MDKKELNLDNMIERINKAKTLFSCFIKDLSEKVETFKIVYIDPIDYGSLIIREVTTQLTEYIKVNFPNVDREKEFPRLLHCRNSFAHSDDFEIMKKEIFKDGSNSLPDYLIEVINKIKEMENNK